MMVSVCVDWAVCNIFCLGKIKAQYQTVNQDQLKKDDKNPSCVLKLSNVMQVAKWLFQHPQKIIERKDFYFFCQ